MKSHSIIFTSVALSLAWLHAGAQTIARIDENDSLIIRQDLQAVLISGDQIDGEQEAASFHYSENIDEILEGKSGISLTRRGNYASEIVVRGMASERLNTTIDGMKIFSACTDKMDPVSSYVSTNNLKAVHCEKGGEGKSFGSSTGGQVNFQLKEPLLNDTEKLRGNISLGANSVSIGRQASFNTNYSEKSWALRFNGMASQHENYRAGGGEEIENSQYEKMNFGLSFKAKVSNKSFVQVDAIVDDARDVGYPALPMDVAYARGKIYSFTYKQYIDGAIGGRLKAKIYGNNIRHLMDDSQRDVVMHMDMPGLSDTYGTYLTYETKKIGRNKISLTIDAYKNRSFAEMTMFPDGEIEMYMVTWPDVNRSILGAFISENYAFKNKDQITWTGRIDVGESIVMDEYGQKQFEVFGYDVSEPFTHRVYSTSLTYSKFVDKKNSLSAEIGYSERLASVSEQFGYYLFNSQDAYDYIGDPYISNELAYKAELGHKYQVKKATILTSVYAMHLPDYILGLVDEELDGMTLGSKGVKQYTNIEYAQMAGFEFEVDAIISSWLTMSTAFTYTYGRDYQNEALPLIPPLNNRTSLFSSLGNNKLSVSVIAASAQERYRSSEGESRSPAYATMNFQYSRKIGGDTHGLLVLAGADNIFDSNYYDHLDWNSISRPGRNFFLKLQYQFN